MNKEQAIIDKFTNSYLGDDGAVVGKWVYSKDLFVEGSHFKRGWLELDEIAYKAMIVNISDAVVMNAVPKFALIGLGVPKSLKMEQISLLRDGFKRACDEFGVTIIGGDTISSDKIIISVTIVSELNSQAVLRSGAKAGDLLAFTGKLGDSLKGLKALLRGGSVARNSRFKKPVLKDRFFYRSAKFLSAAMDISDGLGTDLAKLCKASGLGVKFSKKLSKNELKSGEEYEILFAFAAKNRKKIENLAKKSRTKITIFAKTTKGRYKNNAREHHF
ncbi:thiamine-phosphate kinase [Campylobacter sp. RM12920]|uniref:Thiamine-monophosphate kinase n=1 Tax=Campylobacter californiensis TaxID=1032243 RepID=A0ABD4JG37_9BACT|nr:thiamine-phosphate kinase [Campylobacter sp. RM12919]MBE2987306.1 thiamine-phosphate kinase [Campylobacter sp. RM12920]